MADADVISLDAYRLFKKIVKLNGASCKRPFHDKKFVMKNPADHRDVCVICGVGVTLVHHPSMKKPKWYG